jgi:hypothetical protein
VVADVLGLIAALALATAPVQGSVFGPVVSVKGTTFTITTSLSPNGKSIVSAAGATITEQATAPRSSLKAGACVMASGTRNSKGVIAAARITISQPVKGSCTNGFLGRGGGTRLTRPPGGGTRTPPAGGFSARIGGFAFGAVTKLSGSTLTVKGSFGSTSRTATVTISSKTALVRTVMVKPTAVTVKTCAFVNGTSADKGASVKATRIALSTEISGKCTNGFRVPGR